MKETLYKEVQEILENDLSCAICQDIYINPLILNCSHSFCKFCVYKWLSKRPGCPQCRMIVSFQAENLALRNIINKMIQKSSPQFQTNRSTNVSQRLKDEEAQEKEGVMPKLVIKNDRQSAPSSDNDSSNISNNNNNGGYNRAIRENSSDRHSSSDLPRTIRERSNRLLASGDHDYVIDSGSDPIAFEIDGFTATYYYSSSDDDDDDWPYADDNPENPEDDVPSDDHDDVTFELGSSSESAESSDFIDDYAFGDGVAVDNTGLSDFAPSDNHDEEDDADVDDDDVELEASYSDLESSSSSSSSESSFESDYEDQNEELSELDDSSTEVDSFGSYSSDEGIANWSLAIPNGISLPDTESDVETTSDDETSEEDMTEEYDRGDDDSPDSDSSMESGGDGRYRDDSSIESD